MTRQRLRRLVLAAHFYLGVTAGLFFVLAGLTGSILVFYPEIDRLLNPELVVTPQHNKNAWQYEAVYHVLKTRFPERTQAWRMEVPSDRDHPVMARYYKPQEKAGRGFAPFIVAINPYTLDVINTRFWGEFAVTWIYDLHYTVLLDRTGKTVMAILGGILLVLLFAGLYLWWPRTGRWRQALALRLRDGGARKNYDLHVIGGVYGYLLMVVLLMTGVVLEKPDWFHPVIKRVSTVAELHRPVSMRSAVSARIAVDKAAEIALRQFPGSQLRWIETPDGERGSYMIRLRRPGEIGDRFPKTMVWIDQNSGKVLGVQDGLNRSGGEVFLDWQHPLHSGEFLGLFGRLIVFVSGFIPLILLVTGVIRWRQKVGSTRCRGARHASIANQ